ncbi:MULTISPECIES: LysR family transcriptional regulator [Pseudomonas]|uniref:LysR family transcriptional regulator n=1 Tax=Pseudomonas TaxID=286 RepID=UPI0006D46FFB|nr:MULTISPECIES: LysR family transcriptional regulator [Pseudomonas]
MTDSDNKALLDRFFRSSLSLKQLRILVALADLGQVRKVAEAMNVSQSAVSKQLAEIQEGIGHPVVTRVGNRLALTPVGLALISSARGVLHHLERAQHEILALREGKGGHLVLGTVSSVCATLVPGALNYLYEHAPSVSIKVEENTADKLIPQLVDRSIDMAIIRIWQPLAVAGVSQQTLMHEALVIVAGPDHPLARQGVVDWAQTVKYPWIVPNAGSPAREALKAMLAMHGLRLPGGTIDSISMTLIVSLLAHSRHLCLLPEHFARKLQARNEASILPVDTANLLSEVRAVWCTANTNPALNTLLRCLAYASA